MAHQPLALPAYEKAGDRLKKDCINQVYPRVRFNW